MKAKYKNTGTKEFPFYTITFNDEYYCATDDALKARNLVRLLNIPVVSICVCGTEIYQESQKRADNLTYCSRCDKPY